MGRHAHHPEYTKQIRIYLERWAVLNKDFLPSHARDELIDLANKIKNAIMNDPTNGRINLFNLGL